MTKSQPKPKKSSKSVNSNTREGTIKLSSSKSEEFIDSLKNNIKELKYEKALDLFDAIMDQLQNDNVPLDELHIQYMKGKLCLEHCEDLLNILEHQVVNIDLDKLKDKNDLSSQ